MTRISEFKSLTSLVVLSYPGQTPSAILEEKDTRGRGGLDLGRSATLGTSLMMRSDVTWGSFCISPPRYEATPTTHA